MIWMLYEYSVHLLGTSGVYLATQLSLETQQVTAHIMWEKSHIQTTYNVENYNQAYLSNLQLKVSKALLASKPSQMYIVCCYQMNVLCDTSWLWHSISDIDKISFMGESNELIFLQDFDENFIDDYLQRYNIRCGQLGN